VFRILLFVFFAAFATSSEAQTSITRQEIQDILTWLEEASGMKATKPFPTIVVVSREEMHERSKKYGNGILWGEHNHETNTISIRDGLSYGQAKVWLAHELAHHIWRDLKCRRTSELFAYELQNRYAYAHGFEEYAVPRSVFAYAEGLGCQSRAEELMNRLGTLIQNEIKQR
jgi:hypothetical protein